MLAMGHRTASDSFSFVFFLFSLSLVLSISKAWPWLFKCTRLLAHLFSNELVCFCRSTADNPLLECTPPNNAQFFTGPSICSAPSPPFILGDASGDGVVSVSDIVLIIAFVTENTPLPGLFAAADVNGDGVISVLVRQSL